METIKSKYGDKFAEAQALALKPFKDPRFVGDGEDEQKLHDQLIENRIIDDPMLFEWARKVGLAMSDDTHLKGTTPAKKPMSMVEKFYGSQAATKE